MPLTNYLMQTLIATFIFYGWGLGFWGKVGPALDLVIAFGDLLRRAGAAQQALAAPLRAGADGIPLAAAHVRARGIESARRRPHIRRMAQQTLFPVSGEVFANGYAYEALIPAWPLPMQPQSAKPAETASAISGTAASS